MELGMEYLTAKPERILVPFRDIPYDQPHLSTFNGFDWKANGNIKDAVQFARCSGLRETGMSVQECALLYECLEQKPGGYLVELGRNYGTSLRLFIQHVIRHGGTVESWDWDSYQVMLDAMEANGYAMKGGAGPVGEVNNRGYREGVLSSELHVNGIVYPNFFIRVGHTQMTPITRTDRFIDFLIIDTEHSLADALGEYMRFRNYLKSGAFVAFHDSNLPAVARAVQLVKEVEAIYGDRLLKEYVLDRQDGFGVHVYQWK